MCNISTLIHKKTVQVISSEFINSFKRSTKRGPDNTVYFQHKCVEFAFQRLSINDTSISGLQPFKIKINDNHVRIVLANAEIFNFKSLKTKHNIKTESGSDCEILGHLYSAVGQDEKKFLDEIKNNEFAIIIVDFITINKDEHVQVFISRDPAGVRPLYYQESDDWFCCSSELKGMTMPTANDQCKNIDQFAPGTYTKILIVNGDVKSNVNTRYYDVASIIPTTAKSDLRNTLLETLKTAVIDRLLADVTICGLLSGGFDSSTVIAIAQDYLNKHYPGEKIITFGIGVVGSSDLHYGQIAADYIGTKHTQIVVTLDEVFAAIPEVIKQIESYDTTTVRASAWQYVLATYIRKLFPNIKVILNGDGSDEITGGYMYTKLAPTHQAFHEDCCRLYNEIHKYDAQRVDRTLSFEMEARVPFLDARFVEAYLSAPIELRIPRPSTILGITDQIIEKPLLRECMMDTKLLPDCIVKRFKNAFSDATSTADNSWPDFIKKKVDKMYTDSYFQDEIKQHMHNPPKTKEELYYRKLFDAAYPGLAHVIPKMWLPQWCSTIDPSARVLSIYKENKV